jgi:RNA binding exosome subunit
VKEVSLPIVIEDLMDAERDVIENLNEPEKCKEVRHLLLKKYGPETYKSWFKPLESRLDGDFVRFNTQSKFKKDWILANYPEIVL